MGKKDQILDSAQSLMLEKGFVATSIEEICSEAGVTKGSFFYYFKDKEDLGKSVVSHFAENNREKLFGGVEETDPLKRVFAYLDNAICCAKGVDAKGCLVGMFSQELSETHPKIRKICEKIFDAFIGLLKKDLTAAKKMYAPKASFKVDDLAEYLVATAQGAMILSKARKDCGVMERSLNQYKQYLKKLYGR